MAEIYALKHPETGEVRYIGKANNTAKRLASHMRDSARRDTPVYRWIRKLAEQGLRPIAEVIEVCEGDWKKSEVKHIAEYSKTCRLLNVAVGGDEPFCSKEQRARNGRTSARKIHDDPFRKHIWWLKRELGSSLKFFKDHGMVDAYNKNVRRLRESALKCPRLFGAWANLVEM